MSVDRIQRVRERENGRFLIQSGEREEGVEKGDKCSAVLSLQLVSVAV